MLDFLKKKRGPQRPFVSAIIAAGGISARMGGENKLLLELLGKPVLVHTLEAFEACPDIDEIVLVAKCELVVEYTSLAAEAGITKLTQVVAGGGNRLESVYKGMGAISAQARFVAVHDGARPCIRSQEISAVCHAAATESAAVAVAPVVDTLKRVDKGRITGTENREQFFSAQTPQVADRALIYAALQRAITLQPPVTDESMALEQMGVRPMAVVLSGENLKITTREDWLLAGIILEARL